MNKQTKALVMAAAVAGLMAGTTARAEGVNMAPTSHKVLSSSGAAHFLMGHQDTPKTDKHSCKGKNDCKGQGGCKSGDNGCKGKNSCKGKGGCATDGSKKH